MVSNGTPCANNRRVGRTKRVTFFAVATCMAWLTGCANSPTTVLLNVDTSNNAAVQALYGRVDVASQAGLEQEMPGPVHLPGVLTVWLPDTTDPVTVSLRALTADGQSLRATVIVNPIPYQSVDESVTLTADGTVVPPTNPGAGDQPDLGPPGSPDLSQGTTPPVGVVDMAQPKPDASVVVLARDNYHRNTNQTFWGTASDGQVWGGDANVNNAFGVITNIGVVTDSLNESLSATLGPSVADADVLVTAAINTFAANRSSNNEIGPMLRSIDNNNFYKAGIDSANLRLFVRTNAGTATLATVPFTANAGTLYAIRFRAVGPLLMAKAWPASAAEPAAWMVTAVDTRIAAGAGGIRLIFNTTATVNFTSFLETTPP